jgi:ABC-2 type transport system ATP-binding protein
MPQNSQPALDIQNLSKHYQGGKIALRGVSLTIDRGEFFGLLGENGAGKSTTIGILTSLVNKSSGSIRVFEKNIDKDSLAVKALLSLVPQEINLHPFEKPWHILINQAGYYGITAKIASERAEQYLTEMDLWEKRHNEVRQLSGGMKRRLMIARALMHRPQLLILDEPTAGIDITSRKLLWTYLQKLNSNGTTILLTTHYLEEAEYLCNRIAFIHQGVITDVIHKNTLTDRLDKQSFIIETTAPLPPNLPEHEYFHLTQVSSHSCEVVLPHSATLNDLFDWFNQIELVVKGIRQTQNRLETYYMSLVKKMMPQL